MSILCLKASFLYQNTEDRSACSVSLWDIQYLQYVKFCQLSSVGVFCLCLFLQNRFRTRRCLCLSTPHVQTIWALCHVPRSSSNLLKYLYASSMAQNEFSYINLKSREEEHMSLFVGAVQYIPLIWLLPRSSPEEVFYLHCFQKSTVFFSRPVKNQNWTFQCSETLLARISQMSSFQLYDSKLFYGIFKISNAFYFFLWDVPKTPSIWHISQDSWIQCHA